MKDRVVICNAGSKCIVNDVNAGKRQVTLYYAIFENLDSNGWIFNSKAFNRTIKNNNLTFPFLREHNKLEVVGKTVDMGSDSIGAFATVKIANTAKGDDTLQLYEDGIYKEHSFVGYVVQGEPRKINNTNATYVKEVMLEEVSVVLNAANHNATVISIENALKTGSLTKEQLQALVSDKNHNDSAEEKPVIEVVKANDIINFIKQY